MAFRFSYTSLARLGTCEYDLQTIATRAIELSNVDFGIAEGHRYLEKQQKYYNEGKSQIDGITKKGKHNYIPSRAFDFYCWYGGAASWDPIHMAYVAGVITSQANNLGINVRWGADWDKDGTLIFDHTFVDMPHIELIK